ncbi:hypothetical protein ACFX19_040912 [Malus domestica]
MDWFNHKHKHLMVKFRVAILLMGLAFRLFLSTSNEFSPKTEAPFPEETEDLERPIFVEFPEGIPLVTTFVHPSMIEMLDAATEDALEHLQAQTNPTNLVNEDLANLEDGSSKPNNDANAINSSDTKSSASFEQKISPRHDLAMLFTCTVCETRSMKTCSRESYEKGVVVACCGGCNNLHLIADHLGYFGKPSNVEQFLAARGEEVKKGSADTLNLTLEDIAGIKPQG